MIKFVKVVLLTLLMVGCTADPSTKKVPFVPKKQVEKKLNDVTFNPTLDILFIIDDSGSMGSFQQLLSLNAFAFIDKFFQTKFIDFHVGVTSSTLDDYYGGTKTFGGRLHNVDGKTYVDRQTQDGHAILARMMNVGTSGDATEEFFSILMRALSPQLLQGYNTGFYRPDAQLAVFVLTDTEDQSQFDSQGTYNFLLNLKNGDETKLFYAAALAQQSPDCRGEGSYYKPIKLEHLVSLHKERGFVFDLCQPDYGTDLAAIADDLVRSVSTVYLDEIPDVTTLKVFYGDVEIPNSITKGWVYNAEENAIYLSPDIDIWSATPEKLNIKFESIYK